MGSGSAQHESRGAQLVPAGAAHSVLKPLLPTLLLSNDTTALLFDALHLIARRTFFHILGKSKPRTKQPKPHKSMSQKPCELVRILSFMRYRSTT